MVKNEKESPLVLSAFLNASAPPRIEGASFLSNAIVCFSFCLTAKTNGHVLQYKRTELT